MGFLAVFLKNFQLTNSVIAGGGASILVCAVGTALVAANFVIPGLGIPLTMGMVGVGAVPIGHIVTALVPDSWKQQIDAIGKKVVTFKGEVPAIESTFVNAKNGQTVVVSVAQGPPNANFNQSADNP